MDPTEALRQVRAAIEAGDLGTACDVFIGLDDWLGKGGFAPDAWTRPQSALLTMEKRAYRLRCALLEAGVPENLVRAIELGE